MNMRPFIMARSGAGHLAAVREIDENTTNLDLPLEPALTITAKVQDTKGKPIPGAAAMLSLSTEERTYNTTQQPAIADEQGVIHFETLPQGEKYGLSISAAGHGSVNEEVEGSETLTNHYEFPPAVLPSADLKLAGHILGPDNKPLGDVNVNIQGEGQPNAQTKTDAAGYFSFTGVCDGAININANYQTGAGGGFMQASTEAQGGHTNAVLRFAINGQFFGGNTQIVTTTGTVKDAVGTPVPGARLTVMSPFGGNSSVEIRTDVDGRYSVNWGVQNQGFPGQMPTSILARDSKHDLAVSHEMDETTTNLDLRLQPALTLTAKVEDAKGKAISTATATLNIFSGESEMQFLQTPVTADAHGIIEIKGLPQERHYSMSISAPGFGPTTAEVLEGATKTNHVDISKVVLAAADQKLAGKVLGPDNKPVAGVSISANSDDGQPGATATTDAQGHFELTGVCVGPVEVSANSGNGNNNLFGNAEAQGGDTNVVIQLVANGGDNSENMRRVTTTGTVSDADGVPVAGVFVSVMTSGRNTEVKTDAAGKFSVVWRVGGEDMIQWGPAVVARPAEGLPQVALLLARDTDHSRAGAVELSETNTNVDVHLQPALGISGSVVDPAGAPVKNASVEVMLHAGSTVMPLVRRIPLKTDAQGAFAAAALPQGYRYLVNFRASGYGTGAKMIGASDSDTNSLALGPLTLKPANLKVEGRVVDGDDRPVARSRVSIGGLGQPAAATTTDAKGHFVFLHVCEGAAQVTATGRSDAIGRMAMGSAEVQAGDTNVVVKAIGNNRGAVPPPQPQPPPAQPQPTQISPIL
jgi:protocatechuate 3,4-dioxygenase beta subunit